MYYESGRDYIYKLIFKHYLGLKIINFDNISDELFVTMCSELLDLSDNELINLLGKIYELYLIKEEQQ